VHGLADDRVFLEQRDVGSDARKLASRMQACWTATNHEDVVHG
jgi:hypothetical protein